MILKSALLSPSSRGLRPIELIETDKKHMLLKLMQCKTSGDVTLETAAAAITVIGDSAKSDVWMKMHLLLQ